MKLTKGFLLSMLILSTGALAAGYAGAGFLRWTPILLLLAIAGWIGSFRRIAWLGSAAFTGFIGVSAAGFLLNVSPVALLVGSVAALSAWDLDRFDQRLENVRVDAAVSALEKQHLTRLFLVNGAGLLLAWAALGVKARISFGFLFFLSLIAVLSLSWAVRYLRRS
jgi:hypothetical protein